MKPGELTIPVYLQREQNLREFHTLSQLTYSPAHIYGYKKKKIEDLSLGFCSGFYKSWLISAV